jgi:CheY-like chemotaxis protein
MLPRIFEPFERGQETSSEGLGLGLAISRPIVEMHSGVISAQSAGIGRGATFTVELPVVSIPMETGAARPSAGEGGDSDAHRLGQPRILVVDDHADTLNVMQRLLQRLGYAVSTADGVESAMSLATGEAFDLVISDLGLQDGTGHELIQRLQRSGKRIPSIAVSGYGMKEDLAQSHQAGFAAHLTKPVSSQLLKATIERLLAVQ